MQFLPIKLYKFLSQQRQNAEIYHVVCVFVSVRVCSDQRSCLLDL